MSEAAFGNIAETLTAMARQRSDALSIVHPAANRQVTFHELDADSNRIASGLRSVGLGPGTRIALMVQPSVDFFALMFGLFKAGTVPVMIDPGIGLKSLKACLAEAEPAAFIGIPKAQAARVILGWARQSIRTVITVGPRLFWGGYTLDQIRAEGSDAAFMEPTTRDDLAAILFTSGSTGLPKGAVYRHGNFLAQVEMIRRTHRIEPGEIDLPTFAPFALFDPAFGMTTIIPDMDFARPGSVDPAKLVKAVEQFKVTNMFGSPAVLNKLGRYVEQHDIKLPGLRRVLSAGAPMMPAILDRLAKALPSGVQVFTPYGATESLPVAFVGSDEILNDAQARTARGAGICVGRPDEGVEVSIVEITDAPIPSWAEAKRLPTGQIGEIVARSAAVTREYFRRPEATALAKIPMPDGSVAHRMGDLGYFDERGRLWFCGRKSHRVITPTGTLFTDPCEGIFNAHPDVFRSALVGVRGEPVICIETESKKVNRERLRTELLALAQQHDQTKVIHTVLFHPAFPVDIRHNAKIFREKLAVWAAGELS